MSQKRTRSILIVDDIPANLDVLCQTLEQAGYNVLAAPNGEAALKIATRTLPDLILLDIMMPGIDGFETCCCLKENPATAEIPIIFITAHNETKKLVEGFQVGGVDYITKPFQHSEVCVRVRNHLTIKSLQDGLREANTKLESAYKQLEADNARKTEELETAHAIQQGFLPVAPPKLSYLDIAPFQKAATEVGGDYYDFFLREDSKLLVAIGDATGHDVGASLMVSATKMALLAVDGNDLTLRLHRMNALLKQVNRNRLLNMALTLFECSYDADSQTVHIEAIGGGMPPCYILRADGSVEEVIIVGMPLGAMENAMYRPIVFRLAQSDTLILMSDGLPERLNNKGEMYGSRRLATAIQTAGTRHQSASEILDALVKSGDDWSNKTQQSDDVTLVVLKVFPMCANCK